MFLNTKQLFTFQLTTPKEEYDLSEKQPHIIAIGANHQAILQYFIVIDKNLVCTPFNSPFVKGFDMLYISFCIFKTEFDPGLISFYSFFAAYIYKIEENTKSNRTLESRNIF